MLKLQEVFDNLTQMFWKLCNTWIKSQNFLQHLQVYECVVPQFAVKPKWNQKWTPSLQIFFKYVLGDAQMLD